MANLKQRKKFSNKQQHSQQWKFLPDVSTLIKLLTSPTELFQLFSDFLFDAKKLNLICLVLLPLEIVLNLFIVYKIPYTEIDWKAYMQEVEGFINGTFNYYDLKGDTGPLVYPAGFVYIYTLFYGITNNGANIRLAQYGFILIYLTFISVVFIIYQKTKRVPPIAIIIMCLTSHRIHSIFLLRLFNDPIAMLFLYASIVFMLNKWWRLTCIFFSLAVSIKMNVLLFSPALFVILALSHGLVKTFGYIFLCALIQLILGAPFLLTYPTAYIHRSFDLGRQFFFIWTVNWKFLPEHIFLSRYFHLALLISHISLLLLFTNKCLRNIGGLKAILFPKKTVKLSSDFIIFIMFLTNYIGICFSRSLHYQFYVWYYHTFAYLLWSTKFPNSVRFLIFGLVELCWNVYPSNFYSSLALNICHLSVLGGLWKALDDDATIRLTAE